MKLQSLARTVVKCGKSSPAKFANFVFIRITRKSFNNLSAKSCFFPARSTKIYNKNASANKINTMEEVWKSEEEMTGSFKKYVQTLVRRTSSDFKTPQSSLKEGREGVKWELGLAYF